MTSTHRLHDHLRLDREGPLLTVTLDNPDKRNVQTPSMWAALAGLPDHLDGVRVVLLRAEGAAFSAGLDRAMLTPEGAPGEPSILELAARAAHELPDVIAEFQRGFTVFGECAPVTVAAVQGYAIGAGFQLALACDLRVVADDVQLAMRETSLGLIPDLGGTTPLVRQVGYARALELCATGRFVGAQEALRLGLAQQVVPAAALADTAYELAKGLLAVPAAALVELKALLRSAAESAREEQLRAEREAQSRLIAGLARGPAAPAG